MFLTCTWTLYLHVLALGQRYFPAVSADVAASYFSCGFGFRHSTAAAEQGRQSYSAPCSHQSSPLHSLAAELTR